MVFSLSFVEPNARVLISRSLSLAVLLQLGNIAGIALIIFSATVTNTGDADSKIWSRDWTFYVGVCLPCFVGLLVANLIASTLGLKKPERV